MYQTGLHVQWIVWIDEKAALNRYAWRGLIGRNRPTCNSMEKCMINYNNDLLYMRIVT